MKEKGINNNMLREVSYCLKKENANAPCQMSENDLLDKGTRREAGDKESEKQDTEPETNRACQMKGKSESLYKDQIEFGSVERRKSTMYIKQNVKIGSFLCLVIILLALYTINALEKPYENTTKGQLTNQRYLYICKRDQDLFVINKCIYMYAYLSRGRLEVCDACVT